MNLILNLNPATHTRRALAAVRRTPLRRAIAVGCALALVLASCASEESSDAAPAASPPEPAATAADQQAEPTAPPPPATSPSPSETPSPAADSDGDQPPAQIIATTTIWADIAQNVACGGLAEVESIIPP
ncbi:MAG: hypothetical protein F4236_05405, partial [Acidimicrobiia bacterium]|nr:hypothetical protein [Acidimicrobiia bacterium]